MLDQADGSIQHHLGAPIVDPPPDAAVGAAFVGVAPDPPQAAITKIIRAAKATSFGDFTFHLFE